MGVRARLCQPGPGSRLEVMRGLISDMRKKKSDRGNVGGLELKLELIFTYVTQKPVLWVGVCARA